VLLVTSSRSPGRAVRRGVPRSARLPLVAVVAVALAGCTDSPRPAPEPDTALTTPLSGYDTSTAGVQRASFCDLLDEAAVEEALGESAEVEEWRDGDRLREVGDIVQEYGCRWEGESATGSGWVLAPPVTTRQAERMLEVEPERGCRAVPDAPAYGDPSRTLSCDGGSRVRFAGLFGDAWLTCEIAGSQGQEEVTRDLAGRWCVAVAQAAAS
jgi:hypothetical protein